MSHPSPSPGDSGASNGRDIPIDSNLNSPNSASPTQPRGQQHANGVASPSSPQVRDGGGGHGVRSGNGSSYSPRDNGPGSPLRASRELMGSPVRSAPPTPMSSFSPPQSLSGSIPRTPSTVGRRSLPGTPRTPFTPMDMQVYSPIEKEVISRAVALIFTCFVCMRCASA